MTGGAALTALDRRILNRIQLDCPLVSDPYGELARDLYTDRDTVHQAVCALRTAGIIRRIGASYIPARLGYSTTLVAAEVAPERIDEAASAASSFSEVTHNYERDHRLNLWFTVIAPSEERLETVIDAVRQTPGVKTVLALPACRTFKLKVLFRFNSPGGCEGLAHQAFTPDWPFTPWPRQSPPLVKPIIARTCGSLDMSLDPFGGLALETGTSREKLLELLTRYRSQGVMRRFGAVLRHQKAGFLGNGMTVWKVPQEDAEEAGMRFAARPEVSHCYQRSPAPGWPYTLYAMVHKKDRSGVEALCADLAEETSLPDYRILFSTREFKKTSMLYFPEAL